MEKPIRIKCWYICATACRDYLWSLGNCRGSVFKSYTYFIFPRYHILKTKLKFIYLQNRLLAIPISSPLNSASPLSRPMQE